MAEINSSSTTKRAPKARKKPALTNPLRASTNAGFALNLRAPALRNLMTEQSKAPWGYATYYAGTQAQLVTAGIPEYLFSKHDKPVTINASNHGGTLQRKGNRYELCIHWDHRGPGYAGHPAATEIARMIHIAIYEWLERDEDKAQPLAERIPEVPTKKLAYCERAEYGVPTNKRFRWGPNFLHNAELFSAASAIFHLIQNAEIMPYTPAAIQYDEQEQEITDTGDAKALLFRIAERNKPGDSKQA